MAIRPSKTGIAGQESEVLAHLSREILDYSRDLLLVCEGNDGIITELNRRFEDITGWKREDWWGKPFGELIHDEDLPKAFDLYVKALKNQPGAGELRMKTPSGELRTFSVQNRPHMRDNKVVGVLTVARDITDRRRLESQLSRLSQQVEAILEHAPVGIMFLEAAPGDETGEQAKLTLVNRKAIELVGWFIDPALLLGRFPEALHIQKEDGQRYAFDELPAARAIQSARVALAGDLYIQRPDESVVALRMSAAPVSNEKKEVTGVLVVFSEASEARDLDLQRQTYQARMQSVLFSLPVGVLMFDPDGRLQFMNQAAETLLGKESNPKLDPQEFARFYHLFKEEASSARAGGGSRAEDGGSVRECPAAELPHLKALATKARVEADDLLLDPQDGSQARRYLCATAVPQFDPEGRATGVLLTLQDGTEIRRLDAWQRQYQAAVGMAQDAVLVLDPEARIQYANRSVERLFGYTPEELVQQPLEVLLSEENEKKRRTLIESWLAAARRGWHATMLPARKPDGKPIEYSLTIGRVETPLGGVYTAIVRDTGPIQDITQRLDAASAYIEALITLSPYPVEVYSPDGRWERCNAARERVLGPPPTSDYRLNDDSFWLTKGVREVVLRAFQGETVQIGPFWYDPPVPGAADATLARRPTERLFLLTTFIAVPDVSGKVQRVVAVHENVTPVVQLEEAMQTAEARRTEAVAPLKSAVQEAESRLKRERDRLQKLLEEMEAQRAADSTRLESQLRIEKDRGAVALQKLEGDHAAAVQSLHSQFELDKSRLDAALRAAESRREILERQLRDAEKFAQTSTTGAKSEQERILQQLKVELHAAQLKVDALTQQWQERFNAVLNDLQDGALVFDLKQRLIQYANPAAQQMLGYTVEELLGKPLDSLYGARDVESLFKKGLLRKLKSHGSQLIMLTLRKKSGEEFDPDQLLIALREDSSTLTDGVLIIREAPPADQISEMQEALKQAEARSGELAERVESLGKSLQDAEAQYRYHREQIESSFQAALAERDAEVQRLDVLLKQFEVERASQQSEKNELQRKMKVAEGQAQQAQDAKTAAQADAEKAGRQVREWSGRVDEIEKALKQAELQAQQAQDAKAAAQADAEKAGRQARELSGRVAQLQQDLKQAEGQIGTRHKALEARLKEAETALQKAAQKEERAGQEIQRLEAVLQEAGRTEQRAKQEIHRLGEALDAAGRQAQESAEQAGRLEVSLKKFDADRGAERQALQARLKEYEARYQKEKEDFEALLKEAGDEATQLTTEVARLREALKAAEADAARKSAEAAAAVQAAEDKRLRELKRLETSLAESGKAVQEVTARAKGIEVRQQKEIERLETSLVAAEKKYAEEREGLTSAFGAQKAALEAAFKSAREAHSAEVKTLQADLQKAGEEARAQAVADAIARRQKEWETEKARLQAALKAAEDKHRSALENLDQEMAALRKEKDALLKRAEEAEAKFKQETGKLAVTLQQKEAAASERAGRLEQDLKAAQAVAAAEKEKLTADLASAEKRFKKEKESLEASLKTGLSKTHTEALQKALTEAEAKHRTAGAALEAGSRDREAALSGQIAFLTSEVKKQQEAFAAERAQIEKQMKLAAEKHQREREDLVARLASFEERLEKDRLQHEAVYKQLEEKYHLFAEGTRELVITIEGEDGLITDLNPRFDEITGWKREEWKRQPFANLIYEQDLAKAFEAYSQALAKQTVVRELRLKRNAGAGGESAGEPVTLFSFTFRPFLRGGRVVGAFAFGHDLSEQQHLEEELSASENRYRLLIENAGSPIILMDPRGHFLDANQRACELLGYTRKQLQRMKLPNLNPAEFERASLTFLHDLKTHGEIRGEYAIHRREGEPLKAVLSAIDMRDDTYLMFIHDLSDQTRLEESLRYLEKTAGEERERLTAALSASEHQRTDERVRLEATAKAAEEKYQAELARLDGLLKASESRHREERGSLEASLKSHESDYQSRLKGLEASLRKTEAAKDLELKRLETALKSVEDERAAERTRLEAQLKETAAQHERDRQELVASIAKSSEEKLTKQLQGALQEAESRYATERKALEKALADSQARLSEEKSRLEQASKAAAAAHSLEKEKLEAELRLTGEKHHLELERLKAALKMSEKRLEEERRQLLAQQEDTESHYQFEIKRLETALKESDRRHEVIVKRLQAELDESQRAREEERTRLEAALTAAEERRARERERLEATLRNTETRLHEELARLEAALSAAESRSESMLTDSREQSEQIMQEMIETVHELVIGIDAWGPGGKETSGGKVVVFNPVAEQVTGYRRDRVLEKDISILFSGAEKAAFLQNLRAVAKTGEAVSNFRCELVAANGDPRAVIWRMGRLRRLDGNQYVLAVGRDVTADEALQALLADTQRIGLVGTLTGGIAHNFNDLMNAILGYSSLLLERLKEGDVNYESVVQLRQAAKRAAGLSEHLSVFSRHTEPERRSVSLNAVVEEVVRLSQETFNPIIQIAAHTEKDLWDVQVDPLQMQQVLMNLMVNARDNLPKGGKIVVETLNQEIADKATGAATPFVLVRVTDTGKALSKDARAHIFDPYYRPADAETKDVRSLGMSVAYGIVKAYEGWMEVESDPATGNSFSICLPAQACADARPAKPAARRQEREEAPAAEAEPEESQPPLPRGPRSPPRPDSYDRSLMPDVRSQPLQSDRRLRGRAAPDSGEKAPPPLSGGRHPAPAGTGAQPSGPGLPGLEGSETVFVVDGNRSDLDLAHVFLKKYGYKVLVASESQQALQAFKFLKDEVRIAVIDLGMPEMDGLQLYAELRRIGPQLRVVFTAKNSTDASLRQEAAYQGYFLLRKPLTEEALARGIRKALDAP